MNLGQMMLVLGAMVTLGILSLNANSTILQTTSSMNTSEFGVTAVSLATSLIEEAMGKMYDAAIEDTLTGALTNTSQLTSTLGHSNIERYRDPVHDFNDFDDFNNLRLVYRSAGDTTTEAGIDKVIIVPGIRAKYYVRARVYYVEPTNPDVAVATPTWHKKIVVTVTCPTSKDTVRIPSIMSYWN